MTIEKNAHINQGSQQTVPVKAVTPWTLKLSHGKLIQPNGLEWYGAGYNGGGNWASFEPSHDATDFGPHSKGGYGANVSRHVFRWFGLYGDGGTDAWVNDASLGYINPNNLRMYLNELRAQYNAGVMVIVTTDSNAGQSSLQATSYTPGTPGYRDGYAYAMDGSKFPFDPAYPASSFAYETGGRNFWTDPSMRKKFFVMRAYLIQAIIDAGLLPCVAMWEPLPEPLSNLDNSWAEPIRQFYREATANTYSVDPTNKPIIVGGRSYYPIHVSDAYDPAYTTWVYTCDMFMHSPSDGAGRNVTTNITKWTQAADNFLAFCNSHTYSNGEKLVGFVQQFGVNTGADNSAHEGLSAMVHWMRSNDMGATHWQLRQDADSAASNGFTQYSLIVKNAADDTDIYKTDEIALLAPWWRCGTQVAFKIGLPSTLPFDGRYL